MRTASGPHGIDLNAPGGVAALLALHRSVFGDTRMEDPPANTPPNPPATTPAPPGGVTLDGETFNFPEATPLAEMTEPQRVEYWRHKARKHEATVKNRADYDDVKAKAAKYDEHVASTATDVDRARSEAREEAEREVSARFHNQLTAQAFQIAAAGKVDPKVLKEYLEEIDLSRFRSADGEPDMDRITNSVARLAPAPPAGHGANGGWPAGSFAGGNRPPTATTGRDAGLEEAKRRFGARQ